MRSGVRPWETAQQTVLAWRPQQRASGKTLPCVGSPLCAGHCSGVLHMSYLSTCHTLFKPYNKAMK